MADGGHSDSTELHGPVGEWQVVRGRWRKIPGCLRHKVGQEGFKVSAGRFGALGICPVVKEEPEEEIVGKDRDVSGEAAVCGVATEITVDSAAEESVCPLHWAEQFGLDPVQPGRKMNFVNASGGRINHWGSRKVLMHATEGGKCWRWPSR